MITPLSLTMLTSAFPPERRGAIIGIWGGISGLGVAAGPLRRRGGVTQGLSWHWVFWVNVPVGIAAAIGARLRLAESRGPRTRLDVPGLALVSAGAAASIWALVQGSRRAGPAPRSWSGCRSAPSARRVPRLGDPSAAADDPARPVPGCAASRPAVATVFLMGASIYAAAFLTSEFFQLGLGRLAADRGPAVPAVDRDPAAGRPARGRALGPDRAASADGPGLLLQAAGFAWIVVLAGSGAGYTAYLAPFIIAGVGISMAIPTTPGRRAERR